MTDRSQPTMAPSQIVARLDRDTKIRLVSGRDFWSTEPLPRYGIGSVLMADGPHGLRKQAGAGDQLGMGASIPATCFPPAVTMASTWDAELLESVGVALGREARAQGVQAILGPGLNIKRHPGGGRNFEYFSEDPIVSGSCASALVRGIQSQGVAACPKHLAVNNQEFDRMRVDMIVDERTLREVYLAGFEIVVRDADPWMMMASYNRINGTHADCAEWLLTDLLRDEWGFNGAVISDWFATADRPKAIAAGTDLEMPYSHEAWDREIKAALESGALPMAALDRACERVIALSQRVAQAPMELESGWEERHHRLAREVAARGAVLLTNDGTLPLAPNQTIAVIGAFARHPRYQGGGSSQVEPTQLDDFLSVLQRQIGADQVRYAPVYDPETGEALPDGIDDARRIAAECDVAVVVVGLPPRIETEGRDRNHLSLPSAHDELVDAVADVNSKTVVILQNGSPVYLPWVHRPAAILEAWLGGQAGGGALVDLLRGVTEPTGRLAESFPADLDEIPAHADFGRHHTQDRFHERHFVGYRFHATFGARAAFAFGHGLGYTTWEWEALEVSGTSPDFDVAVSLTNVGNRHGSELVQVYAAKPDSVLQRPRRVLVGFARVEADPGQTVRALVTLNRRAFITWDVNAHDWLIEGGAWTIDVGSSGEAIHLTTLVDVQSTDVVTPDPGSGRAVASDDELAALFAGGIPDPDPLFPFHRDSTIDDLSQTRLGRIARRAALLGLHLKVPVGPDDPDMAALVEDMALQTPLRVAGINAAGSWGLWAVDRMTTVLNAATRKRS